ncbi:MAG: DNA polymerase III subunit [Patescibacteria group bacterium]
MGKVKSPIGFSWPLIGNPAAVEFLTKSLMNNRLAQTYIFAGPDNLGKNTIADCFAKNLLLLDENRKENLADLDESKMSLSGDFHVVKREAGKKNISIEQIRDLIKILEMSSFANSYKIGIIKEAETISEQGMNALLKILEEPRSKVVIILITSHLESILKTIVSRSQIVNFYPVKTETIHDYLVDHYKLSPVLAKNLSHLALGRVALAIKFLEDKQFYQDYLDSVNLLLEILRSKIPDRFKLISKLATAHKGESDLSIMACNLISIWEGVIRDLLLLNFGSQDLLQHEIVKDDLRSLQDYGQTDDWLNILKLFRLSRKHLSANVNYKNVLENIVVNI